MAMTSGLLAMAIMGADGAPVVAEPPVPYTVRIYTVDGLDWRSKAHDRLLPVARQGTSTVWTADRFLAESFAASAKPGPVVRSSGSSGSTAAVRSKTDYVAQVKRVADGPVDDATKVAFRTEMADVVEGLQARVTARKLDQGHLARVVLEDTHVRSIHTVRLTEMVTPPDQPTGTVTPTPVTFGQSTVRASIQSTTVAMPAAISINVQVPEVSSSRVEGEWLVPESGVLVVSLGVDTVADPKGMAVVRDRVAILDFNPEPDASTTALNTPTPPSRSLPEPVDPAGNVVDLPPLPEAVASADLDRIRPNPDQPSPQAPNPVNPMADPMLARTSFEAPDQPVINVPGGPVPASVMAFAKKLMFSPEFAEFDFDVDFDPDGSPTLTIKLNDTPRGSAEAQCPADLAPKAPEAPSTGEAKDLATVPASFLGGAARAFGALARGEEVPACTSSTSKGCTADRVGRPSVAMGVNVKDSAGTCVLDMEADLNAALKSPGRAQTIYVPLGGKLAFEIKAKVVPTTPEIDKALGETSAPAFPDAAAKPKVDRAIGKAAGVTVPR